jgi:hypothetical protein
MKGYIPFIVISQQMIEEAQRLIPATRVTRTIASEIDTLTGHLGEFAFAQFFLGDWQRHRVGKNKGEIDFGDIEIKTSAFPFSTRLNLLVREDYAQKRKPRFYIQIVIDVQSSHASSIAPDVKAFICGFASAEEVDAAPKRDFGSKHGKSGGYLCHYIPITRLRPITQFSNVYLNCT